MGRRAAWGAGAVALGHRLHARLAVLGVRAAPALTPPDPRPEGDAEAGARLLAEGWPADEGFSGLDDLAALGDGRARALAQARVAEWLVAQGGGRGPGWTPEATALRLGRWAAHARFLLHRGDDGFRAAFARGLDAQATFVARRWPAVAPGLPRLLALAALIEALSALGRRDDLSRMGARLGAEAARAVDAGGAVATRSPEDLLGAVAALLGAGRALAAAGLSPDPAIGAAVARAAPTLRALRHADGGLARFHGGDRGPEGRLDQALAEAGRPTLSGARPGAGPGGRAVLHMGFARLAAGRVTVIADAAPPPTGPASAGAHASTLAFEMTSARRPLVVGMGPGRGLDEGWRRAVRATAGHSTLALDGASSSRLGPDGAGWLAEVPARVLAEATPLSEGLRVELAHDGWRPTHGLTHARTLELSADGRRLAGEDLLTTLTTADAVAFDRAVEAAARVGLAFVVRFHLHPEVEAEMAEEGGLTLARLGLPSGEAWELRHDGAAHLTLEPTAHLEGGQAPRPAWAAVLSGRALSSTTRVRWSLARAPGTPEGLRDLAPGRRGGGDGRGPDRGDAGW